MRTEFFEKRNADVLLVGLPGIGRVGHVAAAYILNKMEHELVANLYCDYFPHHVIIEDGKIRLIRNQLFYVHADHPFLLLTGDSQPVGSSPSEFYEFSADIVALAKDLGVKEIYTMAGIDRGPARFVSSPGVFVAGTDDEILGSLKDLGAKIDKGGTISGAAGLILGIGALNGVKGACLMGETSTQLTAHGDPGAALAVLRIISKHLGFGIDLSELEGAAENFENLLKKMVTPPKEEQKTPEPLDYIR